MFNRSSKNKTSAFSLMEVMIAIVILALMSASIMSLMMYSSKATRLNTNSVTAKNIAQGFFEQMAIDSFTNINSTQYPNITFNSTPPVFLDEAMDIRCQVNFDFKGFGTVSAGGNNTLSDSSQSWVNNEWVGDTLYIVQGKGSGQFANITANSASTLTVDSNWTIPPDSSAKYMINNGKTVEITTTWQYRGQAFSRTIESLVVNYRNDENIGF